MSLLQALRDATKEIHEQLHEHPLLVPLSKDTLKVDEYRHALSFFSTYYKAQEARRDHPLPHPLMPDAPVLTWLKEDMKSQNMTRQTFQPSCLNALPLMQSPEAVTGYLYTKQGSTLGGQMMSKTLTRALHLEGGTDQQFFYGYGKGTGEAWKRFQTCLGDIEISLDINLVCVSALESFTLLSQTADEFYKLDRDKVLEAAQ